MNDIINSVINNRYKIIKKISSTLSTDIYLGYCQIFSRQCIVRVLKEDLAKNENFINQFLSNVKSALKLKSPYIIPIFDALRSENVCYSIYDYFNGVSLEKLLENKSLSINDAIFYIHKISLAIYDSHFLNLIHSEFSPSSIFVDNEQLKIIGFELDCFNEQALNSFIETNSINSAFYFSPEKAKGTHLSKESDIYSFGSICYHILTNRPVFKENDCLSIILGHIKNLPDADLLLKNNDIPLEISNLVLRMLEKNADLRPKIEEIKNTLESIIKNEKLGIIIPKLTEINEENAHINFDKTTEINNSNVLEEKLSNEKNLSEYVKDNVGDDLRVLENVETLLKNDEISTKHQNKIKRNEMKEDEKNEENDEENENSGFIHKFVVFLAATCSIILVAFIGVKTLPAMGINIKPVSIKKTKDTEIPNLIGKKYSDVIEKYRDSNFKITKTANVKSNEEEGVIVSQNPEVGKKIKEKTLTEIYVKVSAGEKQVVLKDYTKHKDFRDAIFEIENLGLHAKTVKENSQTIPINSIIKQYPLKGSKLDYGDEVILYVSIGPGEEENRVIKDKEEKRYKDKIKIEELDDDTMVFANKKTENEASISGNLKSILEEKIQTNDKKEVKETNKTTENKENIQNKYNKEILSGSVKENLKEKEEKSFQKEESRRSGYITLNLPNKETLVTIKSGGEIIYNEKSVSNKLEIKLVADRNEIEIEIYYDNIFISKKTVKMTTE